tara:strand:+ start:183 stop:713 length:531 start_codon:yes stop_codon:yes gene_type:complete
MLLTFEKSFASHEKAKFWHLTKNNGLLAKNVSKCSNKKYWFHCQVCGHDFDKRLNAIVKNGWCNYCSGHKITECYKEKCDYCYKRLFISHEKSKYWHVTKNGKITPKDIKKSSKDSYWFTCNICSHDFESRVLGPPCPSKRLTFRPSFVTLFVITQVGVINSSGYSNQDHVCLFSK